MAQTLQNPSSNHQILPLIFNWGLNASSPPVNPSKQAAHRSHTNPFTKTTFVFNLKIKIKNSSSLFFFLVLPKELHPPINSSFFPYMKKTFNRIHFPQLYILLHASHITKIPHYLSSTLKGKGNVRGYYH